MNKHCFIRSACLALLLIFCLVLSGCGMVGGANSRVPAAEPTPAPTPEPVRFSGGEVEYTAQTLRMPLASGETAMLDSLPYLQSADLSGSANEEEVARWAAAHPQVQTRYTVTMPNGTVLDTDTQSVDLKGMSSADCEAAAYKLALLPGLKTVDLGAEGGALGWSDIGRLRQILPTPVFKYAFKLYGLDCNLSDTTINLYRASITDDGRLVDEVMSYMPQLTYVDMDSCGLQPKRLEEINLNHPNAKVVFRVFFGDNYTARTDAERILASMASRGGMLNDSNVEGLYYCHDVKYLDLGHNTYLTNIGFTAQMPKLEVAILAMCNIRDISPLANCPNLEYLELANTYCDDLRPLSGLANLRHLNVAGIGYDYYGDGTRPSLKDITPLYSLTGLERLWLGGYNPIPSEQIQEMQRRAPQCEIDTSVYEDPVGGRWRYVDLANYIDTWVDTYHPRYEKLRQQFGDYEYTVYNFTWNDPMYDANYVPPATATPAATPTPAPAATPIPQYQPGYNPNYYDPSYYDPNYYGPNSGEPGYEDYGDPYQNQDVDPYAQQAADSYQAFVDWYNSLQNQDQNPTPPENPIPEGQDQFVPESTEQTTAQEQTTTQEQDGHEGEPIVVTLLPSDNNEG